MHTAQPFCDCPDFDHLHDAQRRLCAPGWYEEDHDDSLGNTMSDDPPTGGRDEGKEPPSGRYRLGDLWRLNRAKFSAAGWRLRSALDAPVLAIRTALFPPEPPWALPEAPPLPLLPAQQAVQARLDSARAPTPRRRPVGIIRGLDLAPTESATLSKTRKVASNRICLRPLVLRNGFWIEPLSHHAHGPRRHYAPRTGQEE